MPGEVREVSLSNLGILVALVGLRRKGAHVKLAIRNSLVVLLDLFIFLRSLGILLILVPHSSISSVVS